ncbi:MAG: Hpt domain-containing protein [Cellvibrionaceae bacterium]|nr:Hpt domain-containing protein [Cellvibrionaceae bacterium]
MSIDLSQFHQVFIEESIEGLDAMEMALMALDLERVDGELINTIFRAAHSIKGGGATFGFSVLADFTHVLETLLDQFRSGQRRITAEDVNLLLQAVDCMRELLSQLKSGSNFATACSQTLKTQFEAVLRQDSSSAELSAIPEAIPRENAAEKTWQIRFYSRSRHSQIRQ